MVTRERRREGTRREGTRRDELIEGDVGPFYVALNRATFLLVGAVFFAAAPLIIYAMRDAPLLVAVAVGAGIGMESGTIAHVLVERVLRRPAALAWAAHAVTGATVGAAALAFLLR